VNLAAIIESHPAASVALSHDGSHLTYGELRKRAARVRTGLAGSGISAGDHVALVFPTTPAFVVAYLGVLAAGAVAVPLNPESPIAELATELGTVRAAAVLMGGPRAMAAANSISDLGYRVFELSDDGWLAGAEAGAGDAPNEPAEAIVDRAPDDAAVLLFTSGTAGSPKAAILTHGSLRANIDQMSLAAGLAVSAEDVGLLVIPPFHIYGLNAVLGTNLFSGARTVLLERFDPASLLEVVVHEQVTVLPGVPQLFAALEAYPPATGKELATVRIAVSGAAPLTAEVAERFESRFGIAIWQAYGLTEASPTVTFPDLQAVRRPLAVGVPLAGIEVQIVDADGETVEHGDPGEILVRGPNVFAGYFEDSVATRAALDRAGWLHTGDIGVMHDDGSLTIVDRSKDLVIVSGFNVFPAEVEHVLEEHPAVAEAVVIGVPDPALGESVRAFVVPRADAWPEGATVPDGITGPELIEFCSLHLARYKCPSSVVFVRQLPRGMQGKALRRALA
jgi:long-chain acyl-CoA synthetase